MSTVRGVATGAAGIVVALDGPVSIVYVLAALSTIAATLYRPAHSALLPSLCRTGHELASANVVRGGSWIRLRRSWVRYVGELDKEIGLLHGLPMLQPLPLPAIEQLARGLEPVQVPAGQAVFRQG